MGIFLTAVGLMMIFEGAPLFSFPAHIKDIASRIVEIEDATLRVIGLILMIFGLGVVYFGRYFIGHE